MINQRQRSPHLRSQVKLVCKYDPTTCVRAANVRIRSPGKSGTLLLSRKCLPHLLTCPAASLSDLNWRAHCCPLPSHLVCPTSALRKNVRHDDRVASGPECPSTVSSSQCMAICSTGLATLHLSAAVNALLSASSVVSTQLSTFPSSNGLMAVSAPDTGPASGALPRAARARESKRARGLSIACSSGTRPKVLDANKRISTFWGDILRVRAALASNSNIERFRSGERDRVAEGGVWNCPAMGPWLKGWAGISSNSKVACSVNSGGAPFRAARDLRTTACACSVGFRCESLPLSPIVSCAVRAQSVPIRAAALCERRLLWASVRECHVLGVHVADPEPAIVSGWQEPGAMWGQDCPCSIAFMLGFLQRGSAEGVSVSLSTQNANIKLRL